MRSQKLKAPVPDATLTRNAVSAVTGRTTPEPSTVSKTSVNGEPARMGAGPTLTTRTCVGAGAAEVDDDTPAPLDGGEEDGPEDPVADDDNVLVDESVADVPEEEGAGDDVAEEEDLVPEEVPADEAVVDEGRLAGADREESVPDDELTNGPLDAPGTDAPSLHRPSSQWRSAPQSTSRLHKRTH